MTRPGPGKFEGNESEFVSSVLHEIVMSGLTDGAVGDVETFGFYNLILNANGDPLLTDDEKALLKPAYIVHEDNNGFFTYQEFDKNEDAALIWHGDVLFAYEEFARESDAYV